MGSVRVARQAGKKHAATDPRVITANTTAKVSGSRGRSIGRSDLGGKNMVSPILVTGAAGRVGAVGRTVTELLLRQGKAVRARVRNEDERAQALRDMGAEVVVGNLLDLDSMHRGIAGCETMYFGMSVSDAYLAATVNAAAVAKHHGVKAFINMSQMTVSQMSISETTASPQQKLHWLAEQALNWSGLPVVHVRPTVLFEGSFLILTSDSVRESNQIRLPFGEGKTSPVAVEDVARVIAALLANPQPHIGKIYHLTGPSPRTCISLHRSIRRRLAARLPFRTFRSSRGGTRCLSAVCRFTW
jgi:uncharacterized protein YbjT (DUF2867 family)